MRRLLAVAAVSIGLVTGMAPPVLAHSGEAGPYTSLNECNIARKKYASTGHRVSVCDPRNGGHITVYYFKYTH